MIRVVKSLFNIEKVDDHKTIVNKLDVKRRIHRIISYFVKL